jgi:hypothetical protein
LAATILALGLGACAIGGAVLDAAAAVLALFGSPLLANEGAIAGFVGTVAVWRPLGHVVEELEAASGVERDGHAGDPPMLGARSREVDARVEGAERPSERVLQVVGKWPQRFIDLPDPSQAAGKRNALAGDE